jgi:pantothenate kinase
LIPPDEVAAIYAPFSRLLRRQVRKGTTYLVGVAGAVSVGKSTTAKLLQELLPTRWRADLTLEKGPDHAVRWIRIRDR